MKMFLSVPCLQISQKILILITIFFQQKCMMRFNCRYILNAQTILANNITKSLTVNLRRLVKLGTICHLDFFLYLPDVLYQKIYSKRSEHLCISYQSSSLADQIKWYRNVMFTYYDLIPRFSVQNIKNIIRYFKDNIK